VPQVRPWILEAIALSGPRRCGFGKLYGAYWEVVGDFSATEKRQLFHDTAVAVYRL
jgi:predicted TIM-barrel fold metal-dependent hydrolase